jgi:diguanylate cyclase (GGDEF)-like protein
LSETQIGHCGRWSSMAVKAKDDQNAKPAGMLPFVPVRAIMIGSWGSVLVLAWSAVVSPDIRWRFAAMFLSALVLAPSLALGLRQAIKESPLPEPRERPLPEIGMLTQDQALDDPQTGIYVDQPTGLASRRYLTMFLAREINRSQRARSAISVAVFDVDAYQDLEQQAGAGAINLALADLGARLKSALREYDLVARYAPGRLALVLPETEARGAEEVVERLHGLATSVCVNGRPLSVTVGISTFPDHGASAEELINSAHRALNRGKFEAANTVHTLDGLKKAS